MRKKEKIFKHIPSYFNATTNANWKALLEAHGQEDDNVVAQIKEAKKQIFVKTAEKQYLDALGDNVAVFRPLELNLSDTKYQTLIPYLSFHAKQVRSLISKVLDSFYDPVFSRYNVQTQVNGPYALTGGESLVFKRENDKPIMMTKVLTADGGSDGWGTLRVTSTSGLWVGAEINISDDDTKTKTAFVTSLTKTVIGTDQDTSNFSVTQNAITFFNTYQYVVFETDDFTIPGSVTPVEVATVINSVANGATASVTSSYTQVNLRTNTVGLKGFIQVLGGTANDHLFFSTNPGRILRVEIAEINANEIIIKIPATIPALRRELNGCAHLHPDSSLIANWAGSFLYDPLGVDYTVHKTYTTLNQSLTSGLVYTQVSVTDSSSFPNEPGLIMVNFGRERMEYPISYIGRPNNSTLLIDPSYVWTKDHLPGESINIVTYESTTPRLRDYAVYNVGVEKAREQVQEIIRSIVAIGIVIRWEIDHPICGKV